MVNAGVVNGRIRSRKAAAIARFPSQIARIPYTKKWVKYNRRLAVNRNRSVGG
jgi:hypothetical protein